MKLAKWLLTHARVHPEGSMPPYAVVQLSKVGSSAVTATSSSQLGSKYVDHSPSASIRRTRASLGIRVHRAHLQVRTSLDMSGQDQSCFNQCLPDCTFPTSGDSRGCCCRFGRWCGMPTVNKQTNMQSLTLME